MKTQQYDRVTLQQLEDLRAMRDDWSFTGQGLRTNDKENDRLIAENMRECWKHQQDGSADWRG